MKLKTRKQLEAIISRAGTRIFELWCEYEDETKWLFIRLGKSHRFVHLGKYFTAGEFCTLPDNLSDALESRGVKIYEENTDAKSPKYVDVTKRAIKRLRTLETRIAEWGKKFREAEDALDAGDYAE